MDTVKLLCFGYAGGSVMFYHTWFLNDINIQVVPIEMAGRGKRLGETPYKSISEIVEDVYLEVAQNTKTSYCMFGHSMGTILICEIMKRLISDGENLPLHMFLSGRFPPHLKTPKKISELSEKEFQEEIFGYGGTPREIVDNKELCELFMPILRADYKAIEEYETDLGNPWNINISILYGDQDNIINPYGYEEWSRYTKKKCEMHKFKGKHFFLHDNKSEIEDFVRNVINKELFAQSIRKSFDLL